MTDLRSPHVLRTRRLPFMTTCLLLLLPALLLAAGCGSGSEKRSGGDGGSSAGASGRDALVVYSGREKDLVSDLYKQFEEETGIDLKVRYAESPELAATLQEEGANSPADVFYAQDAGAIGSVEPLLARLPQQTLTKVDADYRDDDGRWVGVTGRVRVLAYNTDEFKPADLPSSVFDLTKPQWKGKVAVAPTNASFEGFVTGMRLAVGDDRTMKWLKDMKANDARIYEKNGQIVDAIGAGEVPVGLVNHYYLYERLEKNPDLPIANHFFAGGDPGTLVNVSAVGILESTERRKDAQRLVDYLLQEGQVYIANEAGEREYPLAQGVEGLERAEELPPLEEIDTPDVDLALLGDELQATVEMIDESGLGS